MLNKFKHTKKCQDCGTLFQSEDVQQITTCNKCNGELKYIGLQPAKDDFDNLTDNLIQWFQNGPEDSKKESVVVNTTKENVASSGEPETIITLANGVTVKDISKEEAIKYEKQISEKVEPEQMETKVVVEKVSNDKALTIEDVVDTSGRVTNAQIIPALKTAIGERAIEKILLIKNTYPEVYESSLKYLGKKNLKTLEELI